MQLQKELIHTVDWDILCILDACRADSFRDKYPHYLGGTYADVRSSGTPTYIWAERTFPDYYDDIIYVSGNPYIAKNVQVSQSTKWIAGEHFYDVDQAFLWGWENIDGIETVPARSINKGIVKHIDSGKRIIAHYMQPHSPFIGKVKLGVGSFSHARDTVLDQSSPISFPTSRTVLQLIRAYLANLDYVLHHVYAIALEYGKDKKIIVTADHGEEFGKGHVNEVDDNLIIPWLEVDWDKLT